jgi:hypothetical protein
VTPEVDWASNLARAIAVAATGAVQAKKSPRARRQRRAAARVTKPRTAATAPEYWS